MDFSTKTKKYFYWSFSFLALFTILLSVYYNLGGFDKVQTGIFESIEYSIAGKEITGKYTAKEEYQVFEEMKALLKNKTLKGTLAVVNYKVEGSDEYTVRRFVGVLLDDDVSLLPSDLTVLEISADQNFRAALTMHPLVMPNTQKIEAKLQFLADSLAVPLRNYTLEKLYTDNSVIVEMFGK